MRSPIISELGGLRTFGACIRRTGGSGTGGEWASWTSRLADTLPDGWQMWLDWHKTVVPENRVEIEAVEADRGRYLGYVRLVGRRRGDVKLDEPIGSIPVQYTKKPLLRSEEP